MKHIQLQEMKSLPSILCQLCGGPMRLIGSEPHPVENNADLLTYCCTSCDEFSVLPMTSGDHFAQKRIA